MISERLSGNEAIPQNGNPLGPEDLNVYRKTCWPKLSRSVRTLIDESPAVLSHIKDRKDLRVLDMLAVL